MSAVGGVPSPNAQLDVLTRNADPVLPAVLERRDAGPVQPAGSTHPGRPGDLGDLDVVPVIPGVEAVGVGFGRRLPANPLGVAGRVRVGGLARALDRNVGRGRRGGYERREKDDACQMAFHDLSVHRPSRSHIGHAPNPNPELSAGAP